MICKTTAHGSCCPTIRMLPVRRHGIADSTREEPHAPVVCSPLQAPVPKALPRHEENTRRILETTARHPDGPEYLSERH